MEEFNVISPTKKIIDELYAIHGQEAVDSYVDFLAVALKEQIGYYIKGNIKDNEDYYKKVAEKIRKEYEEKE